MDFQFSLGDIYQANFPFDDDESQFKARPVFVWRLHSGRLAVLASKITGSAGRSKWEAPLLPGAHSGLAKPCVIRVDQTKYLPLISFLYPRGTLNAFEILAAQKLFADYAKQR